MHNFSSPERLWIEQILHYDPSWKALTAVHANMQNIKYFTEFIVSFRRVSRLSVWDIGSVSNWLTQFVIVIETINIVSFRYPGIDSFHHCCRCYIYIFYLKKKKKRFTDNTMTYMVFVFTSWAQRFLQNLSFI